MQSPGCTGISQEGALCGAAVEQGRAAAPEPSLSQGVFRTSPFLWEPSILCLAGLRLAVAKPDPSSQVHRAGTDGGEGDRQREQGDPLASSEPCPQWVAPTCYSSS